jgi:hypothetical protein
MTARHSKESAGKPVRCSLRATPKPKVARGLEAAAQRGADRIRRTWRLPYSFLRYCGLSLW